MTLLEDERARLPSHSEVRLVSPRPDIDVAAAARAVRALLTALGADLDAEQLRETPRRAVQAYADLLSPRDFNLTTFANEDGYDELVVARDIPFHSVCAHHLLPFMGVAHVGYLPDGRILGLSKLARVVGTFSRTPQSQEQLTQQVADWIDAHLGPRGVGVVVEAKHLCMSLRGVQARGSEDRHLGAARTRA